MDRNTVLEIVESIKPERCAELAVRLVDIPSLTGNEQPIAECVRGLLRDMGADAWMQEFEPGRYNAIGRVRGRGGGATLLFNGHMDIAFSGTEQYLPPGPGYQPKALVRDGWIYGMGVHNMKSGCAAFLAAAEAIRKSGIELRGDLLMAFVGGEIERHSVNQYQGAGFRGGGCGTRHFVTNGGIADMAVVGEPTRMMLINEHVGSVAVRVTTRGMPAPLRVADHGSDAIRKMRVLIDEFDAYAGEYSERHTYKGGRATVHMHSIEGGWPFRCNRVPIFCHVFLEYRLMPDQKVNEVPLDLEVLLERVRRKRPDIAFDTEFFVTLPPAQDCSKTAIANAMREAHRRVTDTLPEEGIGLFYSDASHLQAYGIPAVNYGPSGRTITGKENWDPEVGEHVSIADLTETAKVYTALALDVCSRTREELGLRPR
ncbi:MAG: M20/M25/M40 family metallo-hydrolase [Burkholderiales bacterium]|nr:M20/M25/M40 family metallo-hydrolase [Burkholderiales bacterium]